MLPKGGFWFSRASNRDISQTLQRVVLNYAFGISFMDALGTALVVGGAAFFLSGLIFLIPVRRSRTASEHDFTAEPFEDRRNQVEQHLSDLRRTRGEIDG